MKIRPGLWICIADMHFPHFHQPTWDATLEFIRHNRRKIVGFIDLGDSFDNESISPHNKGKSIYQVPGSFKAESDDYKRLILDPLEVALPKHCIKVAITGNHSRWEQDFTDLHPELLGVVDRFAYLGLKERGWEIVPLGMHYRIGKLTCIHGDQLGGAYGAGVMPARKAVDVYAGNVLMGHTHSPQAFCKVSPVDQTQKHMGYVSPVLGTTNAHFMRNRPNSWAQGFTIVDVREDGNFNVFLILVCDGQFSVAGETYGKKRSP
jgi:predicted phosphodiesterase